MFRIPFAAGALIVALGCAAVAQAQNPVPVVVDRVRSQPVVAVKPATGIVHSRRTLEIMAGVAGRVEWVAEAGTWVEAGAPLLRIDVTPLALQRDEEQAQARRARINQRYFQAELARLQQQSEFSAKGAIDEMSRQRDLAGNDLEIANLRVRQLEDQIARAELRAPFAGVVSEQLRYAGEELMRGETVGRLVSVRDLELRAQLPLSWLNGLKAGDVVQLRNGEKQLLGRIRSLIAAGSAQSQTFEARIDLPADAPDDWVVGQLADVSLPRETLARALMVPRDALVLRRDQVYVFRIDEQQRAQRIEVTPGTGQGDWVAVTGDLEAGQLVAVRGAERLQQGQAVNIVRDLAEEPGVTG